MFLEIFRTGNHTDSKGFTEVYTATNLDSIVSKYAERLSHDPESLAPIVLGHPENHDASKGWVKRLFRRGKSLFANVDFTDNEFKEAIKSKQFRNVSIALDDELNFIHLGFLGAVAPAVKGLNPMKYVSMSEFEVYSNDISEYIFDSYSEELIDKLYDSNREYQEEIKNYQAKIRQREFTDYVNSEFDNIELNVFSKTIRKDLIALLEAAHNNDSNNPDSPTTDVVKSLIKELAEFSRRINVGKLVLNDINNFTNEKSSKLERNILHSNALELMKANPGLSYDSALDILNSNL